MLYEVTADYRPQNPNKPKYYVIANNKREAKRKFSDLITWLKIYEVKEIENGDEIISHPEKHIIIDG